MNAVTSHVAVCGKTAENFQITLNIVLMKLTTKRSTSEHRLTLFPIQMFYNFIGHVFGKQN